MSVRTLRYNTATQHFTKSALASTDRDALAFLEAAQIYNTNQQRAIVNLVRSLKRVGLWSKMKAIYPFVGGTATSHKWNLKDPRDVDAAFRLTFAGGWTHSNTGALPNGTNTYADTFCIPNSHLTNNNTHMSYYSRTAASGSYQDMGLAVSSASELLLMLCFNGAFYSDCYSSGNGNRITQARANSRYYGLQSRTSSTSHKYFINGTQASGTDTKASSGFTGLTRSIYVGARNTPGSNLPGVSECAFATIGDGLTDSEASALYNIVDLYQKRLGRAV